MIKDFQLFSTAWGHSDCDACGYAIATSKDALIKALEEGAQEDLDLVESTLEEGEELVDDIWDCGVQTTSVREILEFLPEGEKHRVRECLEDGYAYLPTP